MSGGEWKKKQKKRKYRSCLWSIRVSVWGLRYQQPQALCRPAHTGFRPVAPCRRREQSSSSSRRRRRRGRRRRWGKRRGRRGGGDHEHHSYFCLLAAVFKPCGTFKLSLWQFIAVEYDAGLLSLLFLRNRKNVIWASPRTPLPPSSPPLGSKEFPLLWGPRRRKWEKHIAAVLFF